MQQLCFWREQKHICGKTAGTAQYMEVDLYAVTPEQHAARPRAKKKEATRLAQQRYNDKKAKRYHVQLVNTNFKQGDYSWTGTYNDAHLPESREQADKDWSRYITRVYTWCKRHGVKRPRWVMVTEYATVQEDGTSLGRTHHHAIIERTDGLTREVLEELWRAKPGEPLGFTRCEALQFDHGSAESLVKYIHKNKRCDRSWRQSKNLDKPITPRPNDTKWTRRKVEEASTARIDDARYWERQYPGWTLNRVETNVSEDGRRHTLVILRRAEAWHGDPGRGRQRK